ncbi:transmembrane protein 208-like [Penaeus japonicus]|uniref:transmembrane protein 208-like n=1 Tax=Penaeus japonicus TaxID=27405 RepID=UPI001C711D1F|nr:transmembrane protein 208-like [Penaeus japonicus]
MVVQRGKQGTKGQKQIIQENTETLNFYRNMILGTAGIYFGIGMLCFSEFPTLDLVLLGVAGIVFTACYRFMASMAFVKRDQAGAILDEGCDLNIEGGIAEHVKDLIILTSGVCLLSTMTPYFWYLWLLAPCRGIQMLWTNILGPWFFQPAPEEPQDKNLEKKQRKLERKMKYR